MAYSVKELLDAARARLKVAFEQVDTDGGDPVLAPVNVIRTAEGASLPVQLSGSTAAEASHQTLAVSSTPVALPAIPASAVGALVTVEDAPVRATWDGTVPTSSLGHKYGDGDAFAIVSRADLLRFRVVKAAAGDAALQITYV